MPSQIFSIYDRPATIDPLTVLSFHLNQEGHGSATDRPILANTYRMLWLRGGDGNFRLDFHGFSYSGDHLFFARPGQAYTVEPNGPCQVTLLSFTSSSLLLGDPEFDSTCHTFLEPLFARVEGFQVDEELATDLQPVISLLSKESAGNHPYRAEVLKRYLKIFLIYLVRQLQAGDTKARPVRTGEIVRGFLSLLERHYKEKKMVAEYAAMLFVTPNYLNETIKKNTGKPAGQHIRERVVLEAKRKATYSNLCMKEIAYFLGFCDYAHFSKFFKGVAGISFSEFRRVHCVPVAACA